MKARALSSLRLQGPRIQDFSRFFTLLLGTSPSHAGSSTFWPTPGCCRAACKCRSADPCSRPPTEQLQGRAPGWLGHRSERRARVLPEILHSFTAAYVSRYAQRLHRCRYWIGEEYGVDPLHDVARDFEKVPFVFERDQRFTCAVVHRNLQRFGQGPHCLDVPLDAQVAEYDGPRLHWQYLLLEVQQEGGGGHPAAFPAAALREHRLINQSLPELRGPDYPASRHRAPHEADCVMQVKNFFSFLLRFGGHVEG
jgi:hypothetical protein